MRKHEMDLGNISVTKRKAIFQTSKTTSRKTVDGNESDKCEERSGVLPPLLHFDKASAFGLSIIKKFFPPQFVSCARTPDGRLEVPCSPTVRILFASLST